jgi:hypothetical protein
MLNIFIQKVGFRLSQRVPQREQLAESDVWQRANATLNILPPDNEDEDSLRNFVYQPHIARAESPRRLHCSGRNCGENLQSVSVGTVHSWGNPLADSWLLVGIKAASFRCRHQSIIGVVMCASEGELHPLSLQFHSIIQSNILSPSINSLVRNSQRRVACLIS